MPILSRPTKLDINVTEQYFLEFSCWPEDLRELAPILGKEMLQRYGTYNICMYSCFSALPLFRGLLPTFQYIYIHMYMYLQYVKLKQRQIRTKTKNQEIDQT